MVAETKVSREEALAFVRRGWVQEYFAVTTPEEATALVHAVSRALEPEPSAVEELCDEAGRTVNILRAMMPYSGCGSCCLKPAAERLEAAVARVREGR